MKTNLKKRSKLVAGIDEAGRGPLAGPVVAAAVILPEKHFIVGLRDSKKLSQKKRKILYKKIKKESISVGIGIIGVETIDKLNIKEATTYAMKAAVKNLKVKPDELLIDGFPLDTQEIPNEGIIGGDDLIDSIKAASIIAKVTRDRIMLEYSKIFPEYAFENHFGYGTKKHMDVLKQYGSTPIHRRSYKPVKENMPTFEWLREKKLLAWMGKKLAALFIKNNGLYIREIDKRVGEITIDIVAEDHLKQIFIFVETIIKRNQIDFQSKPKKKIGSSIKNIIEKTARESDEKHDIRIDLIIVKFLGDGKPIIDHHQNINSF